MKTFKQFREECGCKDKARKSKKKGNVEVMPTINDGKKGMVSQVNNESVFAGNYEGPFFCIIKFWIYIKYDPTKI